jgi:hypothetical protein
VASNQTVYISAQARNDAAFSDKHPANIHTSAGNFAYFAPILSEQTRYAFGDEDT